MAETNLNPVAQQCLQQLLQVWFDFERRLNRVPIIKRLENGTFSIEDYRNLLLHMRQQVIEGSRWITRCASSFNRDYADVRSTIIGHAKDEHKDYEMLERDYANAGGNLDIIRSGERNVGSEALHAFLMYRASHSNPIDLVGAMWMIEGLGQKMASNWADRVDELTAGDKQYTTFLRYHGLNDESHMDKFYLTLDDVCQTNQDSKSIVKTAKVVGRLYAMQLEEIDES